MIDKDNGNLKEVEYPVFHFTERHKCVCCGSNDLSIVMEREFVESCVFDFINEYYKGKITKNSLGDHKYTIARCNECKFLFQKYILDSDGMFYLYENVIDPIHSLNKKERAPYSQFRDILKSASVVVEFFPGRKPREVSVLDFGMGWGHWAVAASALGLMVKGVELSQQRILFAKQKGVDVITDFKNDETKFDFINTDQVFEHLEDPLDTGKILYDKLNQGGILKIFVPNGSNAENDLNRPGWQASKNHLHPLEHINCFNWNSLNMLAKRLNLRPATASDFKKLRSKLRALRQLHFIRNPSWYFVKD